MVAASALISGLGGEKERWTQQSKEFQEQIGRYSNSEKLATSLIEVKYGTTPSKFYMFRYSISLIVVENLIRHCSPFAPHQVGWRRSTRHWLPVVLRSVQPSVSQSSGREMGKRNGKKQNSFHKELERY